MRPAWLQRILDDARTPGAVHVTRLIALRLVGACAALGSSIVVARLLGPEQKGIVTAALVLPMMLASFTTFGLPYANVYFLHQTPQRGALFVNGMLFAAAMSLAGIGLCLACLPALRSSYFAGVPSPGLITLALLALPLSLFRSLLLQFLRGLEHYRTAAAAGLVFEAAKVVLILVLWLAAGIDLAAAFCIAVGAAAAVDLFLLGAVLRALRGETLRADAPLLRRSLVYGLKEHAGTLLSTVDDKLDLLLLTFMLTRADLGIYAVAIGLGASVQLLPESISFVLLPRLAKARRLEKQHLAVRRSIIYSMGFLLLAWILFLAIGRPLVRLLYGEAFAPAYGLTSVMMLGMVALSIVSMINKFFSAIGRPEKRMWVRMICLPIKCVLLIGLSHMFGMTGAAWAYTLSCGVLLALTVGVYRRHATPPPDAQTA